MVRAVGKSRSADHFIDKLVSGDRPESDPRSSWPTVDSLMEAVQGGFSVLHEGDQSLGLHRIDDLSDR